MTITALPTRNEYTATAGQTVFTYTFKIFEDTDLNVYKTQSGQTADDTADIITAYTVAGAGDEAGGTITLTTPASSGDLITIVSDIPAYRTEDYQNNGDFRPDAVNNDFDRVVSLTKQVEDLSNRALLFQESQQGASQLDLPEPEAGKYLRWNTTVDGVENVDLPDSADVSTLRADLLAPGIGFGADIVTNSVKDVATLADLKNHTPTLGKTIYIKGRTTTGDGGQGHFVGSGVTTDLSTEVTADTLNGIYAPPNSDPTGASGAWVRQVGWYVTPEMFGAYGNGNRSVDSPTGLIDDDAIEAAINYYDGGQGIVQLGPKAYRINHIEIPNRIILQGTASKLESIDGAIVTGTVLQVHNTVSTLAVKLVNSSCGLKNIVVLGETGNTADGVQFFGNANFLDTVTVMGMGGDGIVINSPDVVPVIDKPNTNDWLLSDVNARSNLGNGVVIDSYDGSTNPLIPGRGPDANGGKCFGLNCEQNGLNGLLVGHCSVNNFHGLKTEGNGAHGIKVMGKGLTQSAYIPTTTFSGNNTFHDPHSEANGTAYGSLPEYNCYFGPESLGNYIYGSLTYTVNDDGQNVSTTAYGSSTSKNIVHGLDRLTVNSVDAGQSTDTVPYDNVEPGIFAKGPTPGLVLYESDGPADGKTWVLSASAGSLSLRIVDDSGVVGEYILDVVRSGGAITRTVFPNGKVIATDGLGIGNDAAGDVTANGTLPSVRNFPIYDNVGGLIGYVPIY